MHQTVTKDIFIDRFLNSSYLGGGWDRLTLGALFDYLEELEESCDINVEFDPVAINCDYTPWYSVEDFLDAYSDHYKSALKEYKDEGKEINTPYQLKEFLEEQGDVHDFIEVEEGIEGSESFITNSF